MADDTPLVDASAAPTAAPAATAAPPATATPPATGEPTAAPASTGAEPAERPALTFAATTPPWVRQLAEAKQLTQEELGSIEQQLGVTSNLEKAAQLKALRTLGEAHLAKWGKDAEYNLSLAKEALRVNDPRGRLKGFLESSGYGNHPVMLEFLYNIGKSLAEGGYIKAGARPSAGSASLASLMFDKTKEV